MNGNSEIKNPICLLCGKKMQTLHISNRHWLCYCDEGAGIRYSYQIGLDNKRSETRNFFQDEIDVIIGGVAKGPGPGRLVFTAYHHLDDKEWQMSITNPWLLLPLHKGNIDLKDTQTCVELYQLAAWMG